MSTASPRTRASLRLVKDVSWATVLDRLLYGHSDAAHLVAPLAIATTLGRGRPAQPLSVPFVLGLNGNAITLRTDVAERVGRPGISAIQPRSARRWPKSCASALRPGSAALRVVPPLFEPQLHAALLARRLRHPPRPGRRDRHRAAAVLRRRARSGEVDGICVGEPWNSVAVERGVGQIVLATAQIWRRGVEKVLALREPVLERSVTRSSG